jgi:hypothetical protein
MADPAEQGMNPTEGTAATRTRSELMDGRRRATTPLVATHGTIGGARARR